MRQFFVNEPLSLIENAFDIQIGDGEKRIRVTSWAVAAFP